MDRPVYTCPECGGTLELFMDEDDDSPNADRWTCVTCNIAYPHSQFPLPRGYVKQAREWEKEAQRLEAEENDRLALEAWNRWARRDPR